MDSLALSPDFEVDGTLFARAGDQGVLYRSTDAAASWRRASDGPSGFVAHPPPGLGTVPSAMGCAADVLGPARISSRSPYAMIAMADPNCSRTSNPSFETYQATDSSTSFTMYRTRAMRAPFLRVLAFWC